MNISSSCPAHNVLYFVTGDADANPAVARPFTIYIGDRMVGFTLFAFDEDYKDPSDRYLLEQQ